MRNSGVCPKCGCTKIIGPHDATLVSLPRLSTAKLQALMCSECGYSEMYIDKWGLENARRVGKVYPMSQSKETQ